MRKLRDADLNKVVFYLSLVNLVFNTLNHLRAEYAKTAEQVKQAKNKKKNKFGFTP